MQDMAAQPAAALIDRVPRPHAASDAPGRRFTVVVAAADSAGTRACVDALRAEGHRVASRPGGRAALHTLYQADADVLLIVGRPSDIDRADMCRRLRLEHCTVPIIVVGDTADEMDVVTTLDAGADAFLGLPVRTGELLARIRALLRRFDAEVMEVNGVRIDPTARRVWRDGTELHLSPRLFDLLQALMADAGKLVTRERLMSEVWNADPWSSSKTLDMHMSWLRRRLGDNAHSPRYIITLRSLGFRFNADPPVTTREQRPRHRPVAYLPPDGSCA